MPHPPWQGNWSGVSLRCFLGARPQPVGALRLGAPSLIPLATAWRSWAGCTSRAGRECQLPASSLPPSCVTPGWLRAGAGGWWL